MGLIRYGQATLSSRHRWVEVEGEFDQIAARLKKAIEDEKFLLLHVIDTQGILATAGIPIAALRQFLFFHPSLMRQVIEADPGAIAELPLKIIAIKLPERQVRLIIPRPENLLAEYPPLQSLATELTTRVDRLVVAVGTPTFSSTSTSEES